MTRDGFALANRKYTKKHYSITTTKHSKTERIKLFKNANVFIIINVI